MDRLTYKHSVEYTNELYCGYENCDVLEDYCPLYQDDCFIVRNAINKLAHYEDLIEQGKMIELLCRVGDYVKIFTDKCGIEDMEVIEVYPHGIPSFDFKSQTPKVINVVLEDDDYNEIDLSFEDFEEEIKKAEEKLKEIDKC